MNETVPTDETDSANDAKSRGSAEPQTLAESELVGTKSDASDVAEPAPVEDEPDENDSDAACDDVLDGDSDDDPEPAPRNRRRAWIVVLVVLAVCAGAGVGLWKFDQWHEHRSAVAACQSSQKAVESAKAAYDREYAKDIALGASIVKEHPQYAGKLAELKAEIAGETVQRPLACSASMSNEELSDDTQMNQQSVDAFVLADSLLKDGYSYAQNAIRTGSIDKQEAKQMLSDGLDQMNAAK